MTTLARARREPLDLMNPKMTTEALPEAKDPKGGGGNVVAPK